MVNYAVLYGMGARALADSLDIKVAEAKEFIANYHERFPDVEGFMTQTVEEARRTGYVSTLLRRRRPIPDLDAGNPGLRAYAERAAGNAPMQGSAADVVKIAMLDVDRVLAQEHPAVEMLLQIHDEIVLRAPSEIANEVALRVKEVMEGAYQLSVPLTVDASVGHNLRDVTPATA
jgi:DNA polymerase-1